VFLQLNNVGSYCEIVLKSLTYLSFPSFNAPYNPVQLMYENRTVSIRDRPMYWAKIWVLPIYGYQPILSASVDVDKMQTTCASTTNQVKTVVLQQR